MAQRSKRRLTRIGALAGALCTAGALVVATASPAAAVFTSNTVGCQGSAVLTAKNGKTYKANATDTNIKVPRDGNVHYSGSISTITHNHRGEIDLEIAKFKIPLGTWGPRPNNTNQNAKDGDKEVPSAFAQVPPGKYRISGFHKGKEGGCAGWANIEIAGSPLSSPAGLVAGALTVGSALALLAAATASVKKAVGP